MSELPSSEYFVRMENLIPLFKERLDAGQKVRFSPKGISMLPMLRQDTDTVVLSPLPDKLRKYDLPLYQRDDGKYILTETETPAGYNSIDPITFTVTAEHTIEWEKQAREGILTSLSGNQEDGSRKFSVDDNKGTLTINVVNQSGSTLPSTGGIGTRIFYIIGGILMAAAAVVLITKARYKKEK